ncbi:heme peroxidase [Trametes elegans]|nr:heme peroxidase [Trametes elegans]
MPSRRMRTVLTFHNAIGFSTFDSSLRVAQFHFFFGGGADGSIMAHSDIEGAYGANLGVEGPTSFSGAVALSNCDAAPRIQFLAGRSTDSQAAPEGTVPGPADTVDAILTRMSDAGFSAAETVNLLASHSVAAQEHLITTIVGASLDSTPSTFDAHFFFETLLNGTAYPGDSSGPEEFRMASDALLARDSRTACEWQSFVTDETRMATKFQTVMAKMALVGQDASSLTDCSEDIPQPKAALSNVATLPMGKTLDDIEASCAETPFASLSADSGATVLHPIC